MNAYIACICFLFATLASNLASAHPFHTSNAEVEWNEEAQTFEVALKLDPNDLEHILRQRTKKRVVLEKLAEKSPVFEYVSKHFRFQFDDKTAKQKPVGFEVTPKDAWVYFEVSAPPKSSRITIENRLFLDSPQQTNTVSLNIAKQKFGLTFTKNRTKWELVREEEGDKWQQKTKHSDEE